MTHSIGIDIGSVFTKALAFGNQGIIGYEVISSGNNYRDSAKESLFSLLSKTGLSQDDIDLIIATGCGSKNIPFPHHEITEIAAQCQGMHYLFPLAKTVIEVGGQSSKVIKLNDNGNPVSFVISEKCAAGSSRFLQVIARILQVDFDDLGPLSLKSQKPVTFTTSCAVFTESEAISRIAEGFSMEDIVAGIHNAIATKILNLVERIGLEEDCAICGGGAKDIGLVKSIEKQLDSHLLVPEEPRITMSLGAALVAYKKLTSRSSSATSPEISPLPQD